MAEPTTRASGSHYAYVEMRRRILDLELQPGTRVYEESLATSLGVSRTPLREAVRQLVAERLLERLPTGGLAVPGLDAREIRELYDCRAALEGLMASEAAAAATADDAEVLHGLVARNAALVDFPDEALRFGKALHSAVATIAANAWAIRLHEQVSSQMERYRKFTNHSEERRRQALREHGSIAEAVTGGDSATAARLAFDHVIAARDEALRAVSHDTIQRNAR